MQNNRKALFSVHFSIFLLGASGLFGKLLTLPALIITLGRVFFSSLALLLYMLCKKQSLQLSNKKQYGQMVFLGLLLAAHWYTFYESIQLSTVALGLLSFSTFPVFVTFIAPFFTKQKLRLQDVLTALLVFAGVVITVPSFNTKGTMLLGILVGMLSGFLYAWLTIFNTSLAKEHSSEKIAFYEQGMATIILLPFLFVYKPVFTGGEIALLVVLGVIFTGLAHTLFIGSLRSISTQTASIITCLEPVYSIVLALLLLGEVPSIREIVGGVIILGAVLFTSLQSAKNNSTPTPMPVNTPEL